MDRNSVKFSPLTSSPINRMTASTKISRITPSLWDQAFNSLDNDLRNELNSTKTHKRDILVEKMKIYNDALCDEINDWIWLFLHTRISN